MAGVAILLAAGKSTRMKTDLPKVLHEVCGRPMLAFVMDACRAAGIDRIIAVVGYRAEVVKTTFADEKGLEWVEQTEQLGTGHAVRCCEPLLKDFQGEVLVLAGDGPLIRSSVLQELMLQHRTSGSAVTLATALLEDPTGYGRIIRDASGALKAIVEHADCTPEQRSIREVNPSYYCFDCQSLLAALRNVKPQNVKGEYYLTDAVEILVKTGKKANAVANVPPGDVLSINTRRELAGVSRIMQDRILQRLMDDGVTVVDPVNTWIDARAEIGKDTTILPFTYITGNVRVGQNCRVGPFAYLYGNLTLADGTEWRR